MSNYIEYKILLSKSYYAAVDYLLQKYGSARDDYFREMSYQRFINGEVKSIIKGKFTRTLEGLYCHHIDEIKWLKISDQAFVKKYNIPFETQRKHRLVYCDLIEHAILHVLIAQETSQRLGVTGYDVYLKPMIEEWYIDESIPRPEWMKSCYHKSYLKPNEAVDILRGMENLLGKNYFDMPFDYHESKRKRIELFAEQIKAREIEEAELAAKSKINEEQVHIERIRNFYSVYPKFESMSIPFDIPRLKIIALLYDYKYKDIIESKRALDLMMKPIVRDDLLNELHLTISNS